MLKIVINSIISTSIELVVIILITLIINYAFMKEFRQLVKTIKKIALSQRVKNKAKAINTLIYNYLFID